MLRKLAIVAATMAVAGGASMGMAYADTPAPAQLASPTVLCPLTSGLVGNLLGDCRGGPIRRGDNHHRRGDGRGNDGRPIIINNGGAFGSSSCGSCGDAVTFVQQPQIVAVPVGAVATGDGSCGLRSIDFGRFGGNFGGRGFVRR